MPLRKLCWIALAATAFAAINALKVPIKEYEVPTPKSRPHDPALAPDGSFWYTGQGANKLGCLDLKTGLRWRHRAQHGGYPQTISCISPAVV